MNPKIILAAMIVASSANLCAQAGHVRQALHKTDRGVKQAVHSTDRGVKHAVRSTDQGVKKWCMALTEA